MKALNFAYYLRGSFELQNVDTNTTPRRLMSLTQAKHILKIAETIDKPSASNQYGSSADNLIESRAHNLVSFVSGVLSATISMGEGSEALKYADKMISGELNKFFTESVTPSVMPSQNPHNSLPNDVKIRC